MQRNVPIITPARILVSGFLLLILIGASLLSLPIATVDQAGLAPVDALFTATSAVCVTGLVVVDTGTYFTPFGQVIILGLIQIGGLGFMTLTTLIAILLGRRIGLRQRIVIKESLNQLSTAGMVRLTKQIVLTTLVIEGLGALILALRFAKWMALPQAAYFGVFHAISAFANAGFDLMGNFQSFTEHTGDPVISFTLPALFILGGLGFTVLLEIGEYKRERQLSLHAKIVLVSTLVLIVLGVLGVMVLEWTNPATLGALSRPSRFLAAFFQGVTPRTAGFSTLDYGDLRIPTLLFTMVLMFIGASPGGTGGGVKTTTMAAILLAVRSELTGAEEVEVFERRLPFYIVTRALAIVVVGLVLLITVIMILSLTESQEFIKILFEAVSAFGTVGLSTGITPETSSVGRLLLSLLMYVGRVGPITFGLALAQKQEKTNRRYAQERIVVG